MKYTDIDYETARKICALHTNYKCDGSKYKIQECEKCPLRRERTDDKGKRHTLICYYILLSLIATVDQLEEEIDTTIEHEEELIKELELIK